MPQGLPTIHEYLGISVDVNVILLPAALRPIKDPLYLLDALRLHSSSCQSNSAANRFRLVIVGPSLDESTLHSVQEACRMLPELCTYIGVQPRRMILRWMTSSFCVANTSESEGMSGTILEAMAVGCPVVARQNAGNCNLVQHGVTGFIFSSAAQALHQCVELANQGIALRTSICNAAAECITRRHSRTSEMQAYQRLLREHNVCGSTSNTNSSV
jgi:glycosyltransferase involved in cell wall biosynthesis